MEGVCASDTCPMEGGFLSHVPSVEGNAVVLAAYATLVPATLGLGYRYKTPTFSLLLATGSLLQALGFSARIILHGNVAAITYFAVSLAGTLLGSVFILSAIFSILPHLVHIYGSRIASATPKRVTILSAVLMSIAAALELTGSVLLSRRPGNLGGWTIIGGLCIQMFTILYFVYAHVSTLTMASQTDRLDPRFLAVCQSVKFRRFSAVLQVCAFLMLVHNLCRAIEHAGGPDGPPFHNEVAFMVANGALPLTVCILLAIFPPGAAFGQAWSPTSARTRPRRTGRLPAPIVLLDGRGSRAQVGDSKQNTPTSAGKMPLEDATMATTVTVEPATLTSDYPSPTGSSIHKNTPGHWREMRRQSAHTRMEAGLPPFPSPKASPTFQPSNQHAQPSPTYQGHHQPSRSGSRRNSRAAQTPSNLVRNENLW